jgi:DNA helicase HerA-like ATPase
VIWLEHLTVRLLNSFVKPPKPKVAPGLLFGHASADRTRAVTWPHERRAQHLFTLGGTGQGKTHLMLNLANQIMQAGEPLVLFDYHGDAAEDLLALASQHRESADRTILIDPTDPQASPGLNPLEAFDGDEQAAFGRASELASILRARWNVDAFGPRTEELLRNTLFVLAVANQTLAEAQRLLTNRDFRTELLSRVTQPDVLDYWHTRYEPLSDAMKGTFREPLLNKITGFLTNPSCRHVLGQERSTFSFSEAFAAGAWVLVNLAKGRLGEHAQTLGNLIFARLQFEILSRVNQQRTQRRLVSIFVDEMQNLAENDLNVLLNEGRKYKASLITGHQHLLQISAELRGSLLAAGARVFFRTSSADAAQLGPELSVANRSRWHQTLTTLSRGEAVVRVGSDEPVQIVVPPLPKVASRDRAIEQLRRASLERYSRPRREVEAAIRTRHEVRVTPTTTRHDNAADGQQDW